MDCSCLNRVKQESKVKVKGGSARAKIKDDKQEDGHIYPGDSEGEACGFAVCKVIKVAVEEIYASR